MNIDDKLGLDVFYTDENNPHIEIDEDYDVQRDIDKLIMACPAGLYAQEDGKITFNYEGCLECGTCRVLSGGKIITSWNHPRGSKGVEYREG
ncbi:MAG: ferredoxin family protein [Clostridiales Family XIII bacterium]|jgi:ferredoxin like protein|nr:ferredoxin family protein [Clostridiales Family XIII bacterium]